MLTPSRKHLRTLSSVLLLALGCNGLPDASPSEDLTQEADQRLASPIHTSTVLFDGGTDGFHSFRIPSIIRTNAGTLLAFAEGRKNNDDDFGDINLVYKRSTNHGATWSALGEVEGVGPGTWGNPTAVLDASNGRVWLFMSWNSGTTNQNGTNGYKKIDTWGERRVYATYSDNDGVTWSTPKDLTSTLVPPNYAWDAVGPGVGIQTKGGPHPGRLIIPAIGRNIYSDDGGTTWKYKLIPGGTSEGTVVELLNGQLMRNDRGSSLWEANKRRMVSTGTLEGGFSSWSADPKLLDPRCEGSIIRYNTDAPSRIMFLNPASTEGRCKMRVRISYDEGKTWNDAQSRRIHETLTDEQTCEQGKGGYSSMIKTADYAVAALIERNEDVGGNPSHRSIEFHKFNLPWILNGAAEP
jgi:sialidase-1